MADGLEHARPGPSSLARRLIEWWALAGGVVLFGVAVMTTWSAASGWLLGKPMPGDFELTEIFVAVAVFAFLPYCQQTDANVTADLFTAGAGPLSTAMPAAPTSSIECAIGTRIAISAISAPSPIRPVTRCESNAICR